jgi:hypothetical protein
MAKIYIKFDYTLCHGRLWLKVHEISLCSFSHGGLRLESILYFSTLFSHGRSVAKIYIKFRYTFSHGGL